MMEHNKWVLEITQLDHWVLKSLEFGELEEVNSIVNAKRIEKKFFNNSGLNKKEVELLRKVLESFEFAIIDLWNCVFDETRPKEKKAFSIISKEYFEVCQVLPIPDEDIEKIKHVLKLVVFSYLGEKWEDGRRFLIENEMILKVDNKDKSDWDTYIFKTIYNAIIYLIRKNSWKDLDKALESIHHLKEEQSRFEKEYLENIDFLFKKGAAYELASLYHLARTVEILATYMVQGEPTRDSILVGLDLHFEKAIQYCQNAGNIEFELLLRLIHAMFKKMVLNSIWSIAAKINSRVTKFIDIMTKKDNPIFELLYPQRLAILERGLLDPAHRAIVVNLPTSGGKTMIAEFRILQALNQFAEEKGWIAYVVPTRALVSQMTSRLRRDLSEDPLSIIVEKMSGALELDAFEEFLLESKESTFDILVTTPEKLSLLIRQGIEEKLGRPLALLIVDEAHNLEDKGRGLNLEILLSIAKNDCKRANFLLLTPFVPNSRDIAKWLDPQNPREISIELRWRPNDRVLGVFYPSGKRRDWKTFYKPLVTSQDTIISDDEILVGKNEDYPHPISELKTKKYLLTAIAASQLKETGNMLIMAMRIEDVWKIADILLDRFPKLEPLDSRIKLVQRFVAAELGAQFPLVAYLSKGIGIHHSGLPDEVKYLVEWLMEENLLKILVATTTIAQGINFPVSTILMSSYAYPWTSNMPVRDFWNLAGRAGRIDQSSLGVIGIAVREERGADTLKAVKFVMEETQNLTSVLVEMVKDALNLEEFDLEVLANRAEWSAFLQYIAHMYRQSENLGNFVLELEMTLRGTYGYSLLDPLRRRFLLKAAEKYAKKLDKKKHLATLSDHTGFSPESIQRTIADISKLGISQHDWDSSRLFSSESDVLRRLIGVMLFIPEVKESLNVKIPGMKITHTTLCALINEWVSGKEIVDITKEFWRSEDRISLSRCVKTIYSKITNAAPWGLAAIQKLPGSGIDFENLSEENAKRLKNIPAMIYYGVRTDEAIMMRMNNVPRSLAHQLGELYKGETVDIYHSKPVDIKEWLNNLNEKTWGETIPAGKNISGEDYKKIWRKLSGIE